MRLVAGIDGCRGAWVVVTVALEGAGPTSVVKVADLGDVVGRIESGRLEAVGIDIPIGLPPTGPRPCDREARRLIGLRRSSVFPAPLRGVVGSPTYAEALARCRSASGVGMSRQAFAILAKVEEVDRLMTPTLQDRLVEVHPEVSFTVLAGHPLERPKRTAEGHAERLAVLRTVFPDIDVNVAPRRRGVRPDDVVDAYVVAWSARRFVRGAHLQLGGGTDACGLRMEINA